MPIATVSYMLNKKKFKWDQIENAKWIKRERQAEIKYKEKKPWNKQMKCWTKMNLIEILNCVIEC